MSNDRCQEMLKRLTDRCETELMPDDLTKMLEEELAKPIGEMDTELVDELVELIGAEMPPEGAKATTWSKISEQISAEKPSKPAKGLVIAKRILAVAAVIVAVFFASFGTAKAFKWTFLLKLLEPVAETFGIYSDNNLPGQEAHIPYTDETSGEVQHQYTDLADMPLEHQGHRVQPVWLPERFSFLQGSFYDDGQATVITAAYTGGEDFFNLTTTFLANEEDVSSYTYEYEQKWQNPITRSINGIPLTLYSNSDSNRSACAWIVENVQYLAVGNLSLEELDQVIEEILAD